LWHIYVLSALLGIVSAFDFPTQQAFIGDLTGMGEVRKAVVVNAMAFQVSRMLGPALAGFVIGSLGVALAFWLNGLSFLAVIATLVMVRANQIRRVSSGNPFAEFWEGLRFISSQPRLQDLILSTMLITFFGLSVINILPAVAAEVLKGEAQVLGLLLASSGAGALFGTLFIVPLALSLRRTGLVIGLCCAWAGLWFTFFSYSVRLPLSMICLFLISLSVPVVITTANGLLQVMAPANMRARLLSTFTMVSFGIQPVSALIVGYSAEQLGTQTAIRINGLLIVAGALLLLLARPAWRQWEASRLPTQTSSAA
jgi:MFS family permease